jgi:hypothetical protein
MKTPEHHGNDDLARLTADRTTKHFEYSLRNEIHHSKVFDKNNPWLTNPLSRFQNPRMCFEICNQIFQSVNMFAKLFSDFESTPLKFGIPNPGDKFSYCGF